MNRSSLKWLLGWLCVFALIAPAAFACEEHISQATERSHYRFTVDYTQAFPEIIVAGKYHWVDSDITHEHFPLKGKGKEEIVAELIRFDIDMSSSAVLAELDRRNFRPATFAELLAFDVAFPEEPREFPIVTLGFVAEVDGDLSVSVLHSARTLTGFRLLWLSDDWRLDDHFLVVHK